MDAARSSLLFVKLMLLLLLSPSYKSHRCVEELNLCMLFLVRENVRNSCGSRKSQWLVIGMSLGTTIIIALVSLENSLQNILQ
jgi:hypothetical protein